AVLLRPAEPRAGPGGYQPAADRHGAVRAGLPPHRSLGRLPGGARHVVGGLCHAAQCGDRFAELIGVQRPTPAVSKVCRSWRACTAWCTTSCTCVRMPMRASLFTSALGCTRLLRKM